MRILTSILCEALLTYTLRSADLPSSIILKNIEGGTFTMGNDSLVGPAEQLGAEHSVTLSEYSMSEAEITNAQYIEFLNAAFEDGLVQIVTGTAGPDKDKRLIQGTATSSYNGKTLYSLDGIRVLKDHDNADNEDPANAFTGDVEPENPLNIAYIDFDSSLNQFYIKDPFNVDDFHWYEICNYQDYGTSKGTYLPDVLNDFDDWAGAGLNLSNELEGWTEANPSAAVNLPTQAEVSKWPVTFIRWWGAWAFADYFGVKLPTEAQWEYAAKGGQNFLYGVHDGADYADANWNQDQLKVATHHVRKAISGTANPFGLYNLAGNAWEWMADNYVTPYDTSAATDPLIEVQGSTLRCWRGGSWNYHQSTLETARRFSDEEDRGNDHFGFRVVGSYFEVTDTGFDTWIDAYFAPTDALTGADEDADGDGVENLLEYVFNSDPTNASPSGNSPKASVNSEISSFSITYVRKEHLDSVTISYQLSTDLTAWNTATLNSDCTETIVSNRDGTETVTITILTSENAFFRVLITQI